MKLTIKNTRGKIVNILDAMGRYIPHAFSYDTKTKKVGVYLYATRLSRKGKRIVPKSSTVATARKNGKGYVVKAYVVIPGSYARIDDKIIK